MSNNEKRNYQNSKALFVMKIIAMSFAILAVVVFVTVTLYKWISELNAKIKNSQTHIAKISARLNRLRKARIKHILKLRREQKREDRRKRKSAVKSGGSDGGEAIDNFENFIGTLGEDSEDEESDGNELDDYLKEALEDEDSGEDGLI